MNNYTQHEHKLIKLLRSSEVHDRFEIVKIAEGYSVKKTRKVNLDRLYLDEDYDTMQSRK